ncbi:MAG: sodium:calcium antiporter [Planctomycetaceae bacterium]|jgi:cation:H+ antiporter|nr:sodium:calcium antiporter [Planctomycetaceae bacterium]MBT6157536.1 sodium:calcium antiporter [Planctomycetaceae bacterium]MBT6488062.1 sodium:calcium antiporter [Planctomycetaceae bacterium]MBT6495746.1 sodium:calcium antiporter [Planctomycetaceae bacterium]
MENLKLAIDFFEHFVENTLPADPLWSNVVLALYVIGGIAILGWAADWLVDEAVVLSERSGMPKVVIGATVVSLGTTAPEVAVSIMAARAGQPGIAMSNAVGSIICDTGLVLGVACMIRALHLPRNIVNRQGWVQFGSGLLLVLASFPWSDPAAAFAGAIDGNLTQVMGFVFLGLLALYLYMSYRWAKDSRDVVELDEFETDVNAPLILVLAKLFGALLLVIFTSSILIQSVSIAAARFGIPPAIIGGTVVAFGTSLPELVTAISAARRGHGDLAIGNVIGADVLNALLVAGAAAAVTPGGLNVPPVFFQLMFPFMLGILLLFRIGIFLSGDYLKRPFGLVLLALYAAYLITSVVFGINLAPPPLPQ